RSIFPCPPATHPFTLSLHDALPIFLLWWSGRSTLSHQSSSSLPERSRTADRVTFTWSSRRCISSRCRAHACFCPSRVPSFVPESANSTSVMSTYLSLTSLEISSLLTDVSLDGCGVDSVGPRSSTHCLVKDGHCDRISEPRPWRAR